MAYNQSFDTSSKADCLDEFAEALARLKQDSDLLFDAEEGPAIIWSNIIERELSQLQGSSDSNEADYLALERNAWDLVQSLFSSRYTPLEAPRQQQDPYVPALTLVQEALASNRELSDLAAIRDWLHNIPSALHPAEIRRGYYSYTKNSLKQLRRTGNTPPRTLVTALDPDAVNREAARSGANWESDDVAYETALIRSLFEYVRAGELGTALDMCRQSDQSWRAASLMGGNLWRDSILDPSLEELENEGDMEVEPSRTKTSAKGGMNRKLWKMTSHKIASSPSIKPYERALYGALSGDLNSVLPVCETWEDQLWAHINHQFESRIDYCLEGSSSGSFYRSKSSSISSKLKESKHELSATFESLYQSPQPQIQEQARHPLRIAQNHIILNKIPDLLSLFIARVEDSGPDSMDSELLAHLFRFFSHFILFLQSLPADPVSGQKPNVPTEASDKIISTYIDVLESKGKPELVALYAAHLSEPENQVEVYAQFLARSSSGSDKEARKAGLAKARDHGLDTALVARTTVMLIVHELLQESTELDDSLLFNPLAKISQEDLQLIRSAEWLTFDHITWPDALIHTNYLTRYFLLSGHTAAAKRLISSLPPAVVSHAARLVFEEGESMLQPHSREYDDFKSLFTCLDLNYSWTELWATRPAIEQARVNQPAFIEGLKNIVFKFYSAVEQLLSSQWLLHDLQQMQGPEAEARSEELTRLRGIYIPEVVFSLHQCLMDSKDYLPSAIQKALELANLVANIGDEKPIWYEFMAQGNRLGEYLHRVREASIAALDYSTNPFVIPERVM